MVVYGYRIGKYEGTLWKKPTFVWQLVRERGCYIKVIAESVGYTSRNGAVNAFNTYSKKFKTEAEELLIDSDKVFEDALFINEFQGLHSKS